MVANVGSYGQALPGVYGPAVWAAPAMPVTGPLNRTGSLRLRFFVPFALLICFRLGLQGTLWFLLMSTFRSSAGEESSKTKIEELIQEFLVSEAAILQERGTVQLTAGIDRDTTAAEQTYNSVLLTFEYGVSERFQAGVTQTYIFEEEGGKSGLGDAELEFRQALSENFAGGVVAVGVDVLVPTGDEERGFGVGAWEWEPVFVFGKKAGKGQFHGALALEIEDLAQTSIDLAGVYPWASWRATLELNGAAETISSWGATPGWSWSSGRGWEWAGGVTLPFDRETAEWVAHLRVTYEFD